MDYEQQQVAIAYLDLCKADVEAAYETEQKSKILASDWSYIGAQNMLCVLGYLAYWNGEKQTHELREV